MQVLITRAREEAVRTAQKLTKRGHQAIVSPVLEMNATGATWPQGVVDALVATSAQAFELLKLAPEWPLPEAKRLLPLFLVGEKTASAARARGFSGPLSLAADAKELAGLFMARHAQPARTLYLAGRDRKPDLEARLREAGSVIETLEVYEAQAATDMSRDAIDGLRSGTINAVLHYSRRSAEIFLRLAEAAGLATRSLLHAAISEDAAQPLRDAGLPLIAIAAEPKENSLLALLDMRMKLPEALAVPHDTASDPAAS